MPRRFTRYCLNSSRCLALLIALLTSASLAAPVSTYRVLHTFPHATESYTEGFFFRNGLFYEGTGINGRSSILVTQPETGAVVQRLDLDGRYFGEGIVDFGPNLYEWTWQSHVGFIYDSFSLRPIRQFEYTGEGWGMTRDQTQIITSDGSDTLRFRDPASFRETRSITVHDGARKIDQLNELEFVKGEIYANIWHSDVIARISPRDGHVISWIDLTGILPANQKINAESVLNGIAYDPAHDRIFVTGKQWPKIFEIQLVPQPGKTCCPGK